jgi:ribose transport system ATP-binding protein
VAMSSINGRAIVANAGPSALMADASPVLTVSHLSKAFGATQALDAVDLTVRPASIHALLGGNGSGKSTLIKILAGVYSADGGEIAVGGLTLKAAAMTPEISWDSGLRFVHQQNSTFGDLSVAENLHVGRGFEVNGVGRIRWRRVRERTKALLERFQIEARPDQLMSELGRGTQTMIVIARALQDQERSATGVLVLDEPTSSLPAAEVDILFSALKRYAAEGQAILLVTHRFDEVMEIADRATMLRDGKLVATLEREGTTEELLGEMMVGRALAREKTAPRSSEVGDVVFTCEGISGGPLRDINLGLQRGEIVGIAGLLGSGRSTLLRTLFGLYPPRSGTMRLEGREFMPKSVRDGMDAGFAYVPEDRIKEASFLELSVTENMSLTVLGQYYRKGVLRNGEAKSDTREQMERFLVKAESEKARFGSLSGGNQQKVILARWLQRRPKILLLDEPTQGVDVGARLEIYALIRQATALGTSVLVVSSEFEELEQLCERVLIFKHGRTVGEVAGADLQAENLEHLVQGGKSDEHH